MSQLNSNTAALQAILETVNALPEAGGGGSGGGGGDAVEWCNVTINAPAMSGVGGYGSGEIVVPDANNAIVGTFDNQIINSLAIPMGTVWNLQVPANSVIFMYRRTPIDWRSNYYVTTTGSVMIEPSIIHSTVDITDGYYGMALVTGDCTITIKA